MNKKNYEQKIDTFVTLNNSEVVVENKKYEKLDLAAKQREMSYLNKIKELQQ